MNFKQLREVFIFTRKERNGLLVLVLLLFLIICLDFSIPFMIPVQEYNVSQWEEEAEKYYAAESTNVESVKENQAEESFKGAIDPNKAEQAILLKLGVPAGIAANWIKYLQKGGRFKRKVEVMKLYGMTDQIYNRLEVYLVLPETVGAQKMADDFAETGTKKVAGIVKRDSLPRTRYPEKKEFPVVALNMADSAQLEALPGIGPVLAARIIKYRRLLGGFYEVAQLKEIYGMTEELWMKCAPWLLVDSTGMKKLEINFLSVTELGRHPYIGFSHAKKIVKQRDSNGKLTGKEDLATCFSPDSLHRLLPYLSLGGM